MKLKFIFTTLTLAVWLALLATASAADFSPDAKHLAAVLDSMHVEQLWQAGRQVDWRTGEPKGKVYTNALSHTHCSAFAAAAAEKLGVYLLRPPEHSAVLLANAQQEWLCSSGTNQGWHAVATPLEAQQLANAGELVVVTCKNPDPNRPGHIAIVRPSLWSEAKILADGPEIIQAGAQNFDSTTTREGFKHHPGAFEKNQLLYFAHAISTPRGGSKNISAATDNSAPKIVDASAAAADAASAHKESQ
jgi:hypothetical protein